MWLTLNCAGGALGRQGAGDPGKAALVSSSYMAHDMWIPESLYTAGLSALGERVCLQESLADLWYGLKIKNRLMLCIGGAGRVESVG